VNFESDEIIREVHLMNITGQLVKSIYIQEMQGKMEVSGLPAGIYILRIITETGIKAVSVKIQ